MTKIIFVKNCGECPYNNSSYCMLSATVNPFKLRKIENAEKIMSSCTLIEHIE
jgi:hypothetical protein